MKVKHTQVAARDGMKAGLRAYMAALVTSGLPQVAAQYDALSELSSNERFKWYCNKFGNDVSTARVGTPAKKRAKAQRREVIENELSELDQLRARIAELEAQDTGVQVEAPAKVEREIVAKRITFPMAMAVKRIATKNGKSFKFVDKLGTNSYAIAYAGKKLTPAQASALIGASK